MKVQLVTNFNSILYRKLTEQCECVSRKRLWRQSFTDALDLIGVRQNLWGCDDINERSAAPLSYSRILPRLYQDGLIEQHKIFLHHQWFMQLHPIRGDKGGYLGKGDTWRTKTGGTRQSVDGGRLVYSAEEGIRYLPVHSGQSRTMADALPRKSKPYIWTLYCIEAKWQNVFLHRRFGIKHKEWLSFFRSRRTGGTQILSHHLMTFLHTFRWSSSSPRSAPVTEKGRMLFY